VLFELIVQLLSKYCSFTAHSNTMPDVFSHRHFLFFYLQERDKTFWTKSTITSKSFVRFPEGKAGFPQNNAFLFTGTGKFRLCGWAVFYRTVKQPGFSLRSRRYIQKYTLSTKFSHL